MDLSEVESISAVIRDGGATMKMCVCGGGGGGGVTSDSNWGEGAENTFSQ